MQVNIPDRQLILSEQATMVEELAASLNESDVVEGVVTRVMEYGAFVSLRSPDGGMHGAVVSALLHVPYLNMSRVSPTRLSHNSRVAPMWHPYEGLMVITLLAIFIDTLESPAILGQAPLTLQINEGCAVLCWSFTEADLGQVRHSLGLMCCICVQGLIHISELAWSRVTNPETVVQPGSLVKCKVINVDRERGKIGLSLKVRALSERGIHKGLP